MLQVSATDADDTEDSYNGVVSYSIISQDPPAPVAQMFAINGDTGMISLIASGLDREVTGSVPWNLRSAIWSE